MEGSPLALTELMCFDTHAALPLSPARTCPNPPDAAKDFCSRVAGDNSPRGRDGVNEGSKSSHKKQQFYGACVALIAV